MAQTHTEPEGSTTYSTPRWVTVVGIIALVLVLLFGIMLLSGGNHGPGRHIPPTSGIESGEAGSQARFIAHNVQQL